MSLSKKKYGTKLCVCVPMKKTHSIFRTAEGLKQRIKNHSASSHAKKISCIIKIEPELSFISWNAYNIKHSKEKKL